MEDCRCLLDLVRDVVSDPAHGVNTGLEGQEKKSIRVSEDFLKGNVDECVTEIL